MSGLSRDLLNLVENRQGDGRAASTDMRAVIWTGLRANPDRSISKCEGYNKIDRTVYVAPKDRFNAFLAGKWRPEQVTPTINRLKETLGVNESEKVKDELELRHKTTDFIQPRFIGPDLPPEEEHIAKSIGWRSEPKNSLWIELAFFELEVFLVELAPNEGIGLDRAAPGGIVDPLYCELDIPLTTGGRAITTNARLVRRNSIDPSTEVRVPRGGGETHQKYRNKRTHATQEFQEAGLSWRIKRNVQNFQSMYVNKCAIEDPEIQLDGDVWVEGIRSSISRGLYEVWTDDLRMGPMLRISREKVQEAAARYTRMTAAGEQRYSTERDHPASADIASTAISPVKVYIEDWFGDPNFYLGLANYLMELGAGASGGNKVDYRKSYYDAGTIDYGKIYNKYEGVEV